MKIANGQNYNQVFVYKVLSDSPADKAGIKSGDQVCFINGANINTFTMDEILKMLKKDNCYYKLGLIRDGKRFEVIIHLKKMI